MCDLVFQPDIPNIHNTKVLLVWNDALDCVENQASSDNKNTYEHKDRIINGPSNVKQSCKAQLSACVLCFIVIITERDETLKTNLFLLDWS